MISEKIELPQYQDMVSPVIKGVRDLCGDTT